MTQKELKEKALEFARSGFGPSSLYMPNVKGTPFYCGRQDATEGKKFKPRWMPGAMDPGSTLVRYEKDMMEADVIQYAIGFFLEKDKKKA